MNFQCIEIANKCNAVAASLVSHAEFLQRIGLNAEMYQTMQEAIDWSNHANLMLHEGFQNEATHA